MSQDRAVGKVWVVDELALLSDDELLAATGARPEAFGVFYERHASAVLVFMVRSCGDTERGLDLTAEAFAAALGASGRYRPGEAPAVAWLFGIARNVLARSSRDRAREARARRRLGIPRLAFGDEALERVEDLLEAQGSGVLAGLADLSPQERDAVRARVVEERDYPEIAAAEGASEAAVRKRVSRGLGRLARVRDRRAS